MVSNVFTEGIMLVASIILAVYFSSIMISQAGIIESIFSSTTSSQRSSILTSVKIVHVVNSTASTVEVYVKNIGKIPIENLDKVDLYFGKVNSVSKIPYSPNQSTTPRWYYGDNTISWNVMDTKKIIIELSNNMDSSTYLVKIVTPNGVSDEYIFSPR